jgi:hypothetical protein
MREIDDLGTSRRTWERCDGMILHNSDSGLYEAQSGTVTSQSQFISQLRSDGTNRSSLVANSAEAACIERLGSMTSIP